MGGLRRNVDTLMTSGNTSRLSWEEFLIPWPTFMIHPPCFGLISTLSPMLSMSSPYFRGAKDELLVRILRGASDKNIPFERMCRLLRNLGFDEHTRGSHHIFTRDGVEEILNLQTKGGKAKPYQVKQVRQIILKYRPGTGARKTKPSSPRFRSCRVALPTALHISKPWLTWNGLLTNGSRLPRNWDAPFPNPRGG